MEVANTGGSLGQSAVILREERVLTGQHRGRGVAFAPQTEWATVALFPRGRVFVSQVLCAPCPGNGNPHVTDLKGSTHSWDRPHTTTNSQTRTAGANAALVDA